MNSKSLDGRKKYGHLEVQVYVFFILSMEDRFSRKKNVINHAVCIDFFKHAFQYFSSIGSMISFSSIEFGKTLPVNSNEKLSCFVDAHLLLTSKKFTWVVLFYVLRFKQLKACTKFSHFTVNCVVKTFIYSAGNFFGKLKVCCKTPY